MDGAGRVNNDNYDDVIVGAASASNNSRTVSGSAYVIYGGPGGGSASLDLATLTQAQGFRIDAPEAANSLGETVSGVGDVNEDGRDDVIVGAWTTSIHGAEERAYAGAAYVVYGGAGTPANLDLASLTEARGFRIAGAYATNFTGSSVAGAGDFDGDSSPDLIVGSPSADFNGREDSGRANILLNEVADQPPVAVNDAKTLDEDAGATAIDVLGNDTDADAGPISIGSKTDGANGTVAITAGV